MPRVRRDARVRLCAAVWCETVRADLQAPSLFQIVYATLVEGAGLKLSDWRGAEVVSELTQHANGTALLNGTRVRVVATRM